MKYAKYILFVVAIILASCTIDEDVTNGKNRGGKIQFMSRVVPFEGYNVLSRAIGDGPTENDIVSLDYVILAKLRDDNTSDDYRCIFYRHYSENANEIITIDVESNFKALIDNRGEGALAECYVAVLANYPELYNKIIADAQQAENSSSIDEYIENHIVYTAAGYNKEDGTDETYANYVGRDYFTNVSHNVVAMSGVPTTGLPRLGNYKNPENGSGLINLATLETGKTYEVRLESLYAKMVFDINVDSMTQNIIGGTGNTFALKGYTIHNLATTVDMVGGTESSKGLKNGTDDPVTVHPSPVKGDETSMYQASERECEFTCYIPERFTKADIAANDYPYPFALDGADAVRYEDANLLQRYKPMIAQTDATYITFEGTFVNHQGHSFDVTYKIYVGNDNYSNFDVVRNRQYNNIITIKGIDNSSDQSTVDGAISIDHRVDVRRTLPIIINLRRETLLDSHFEVRPMRIRANTQHTGGNIPEGSTAAVKVEVEYAESDPAKNTPAARWIGLERSYGGGNENKNTETAYTTGGYCDGYGQLGASSAGKRKYFTTNLTTSTLSDNDIDNLRGTDGFSNKGGQVVIAPVDIDGECIWIYVDECLEASTDLNAIRSAKIKVYNGYLGTVDNQPNRFIQVGEPIEYSINQHKLFKIVSTKDPNRVYYIEHEEEYLYNFDADDNYEYNQTQFEGMMWGLNGVQLSNLYSALYLDADPSGLYGSLLEAFGVTSAADLVNNALKENGLDFKYDFYIWRDVKDKPEKIQNQLKYRDYSGFIFNTEIANYILNTYSAHQGENSTADAKINGIRLDEQPKSAFAYCYNRNKRNANGLVVTQDWYMPSIDELEEIMELAHMQFIDFQGQLYWSCQPAYESHLFIFDYWTKQSIFGSYKQSADITGSYFVDDPDRARATRVERENGAFKEVISSASDPFGTLEGELRVTLSLIDKSRSFTKGNYNNNANLNFNNHKGNKFRTDECRVRAVRKMN